MVWSSIRGVIWIGVIDQLRRRKIFNCSAHGLEQGDFVPCRPAANLVATKGVKITADVRLTNRGALERDEEVSGFGERPLEGIDVDIAPSDSFVIAFTPFWTVVWKVRIGAWISLQNAMRSASTSFG